MSSIRYKCKCVAQQFDNLLKPQKPIYSNYLFDFTSFGSKRLAKSLFFSSPFNSIIFSWTYQTMAKKSTKQSNSNEVKQIIELIFDPLEPGRMNVSISLYQSTKTYKTHPWNVYTWILYRLEHFSWFANISDSLPYRRVSRAFNFIFARKRLSGKRQYLLEIYMLYFETHNIVVSITTHNR